MPECCPSPVGTPTTADHDQRRHPGHHRPGDLNLGNYAAAISNSGALVFNSTSPQILSGAISGSGGLTQAGASALTLTSTANNYSGNTTVTAGAALNIYGGPRRAAAA